MNRFIPDTWLEWLLRPLTMAAPNGWVYTEIMAPDFRFVIAMLLAVLVAVGWRRKAPHAVRPAGRELAALGALTAIAFLPWLATSGNGRYFMPFLILIGPLCVGLAARLPGTKAMRAFAVALVVASQAFALAQNNPWRPFDGWEWIGWKDAPYFDVDRSAILDETDVTYVTVANLTFSLLAPQFPASVRWVNLSAFDTAQDAGQSIHYRRIQTMLATGKLRLFQRAQVGAMDPVTLGPSALAIDAINAYLLPHRLRIRTPVDCKLLRSRSLQQITSTASEFSEQEKAVLVSRAGFWDCALERNDQAVLPRHEVTPAEVRARRIFEQVEAQCPRFFSPGQQRVIAAPPLWVRSYPGSDATLMLAPDDTLYMKYERALNPQLLGHGEAILTPGFRLNCDSFTGRAGLPWERQI